MSACTLEREGATLTATSADLRCPLLPTRCPPGATRRSLPLSTIHLSACRPQVHVQPSNIEPYNVLLATRFASGKPRRPPGLLHINGSGSIHSQPSAALWSSLACWACMNTQGPDRLPTCCCCLPSYLASVVGRRHCFFPPTSLVLRNPFSTSSSPPSRNPLTFPQLRPSHGQTVSFSVQLTIKTKVYGTTRPIPRSICFPTLRAAALSNIRR